MLWRIGIGLMIVGGFLVVFGFREARLASGASAQPEQISLSALIARGPEGNPHIILTDFQLSDPYIVEQDKGKEKWNKVWVPVVPTGRRPNLGMGQLPGPGGMGIRTTNPQALVYSLKCRDQADLNTRVNVPQLQGMVINRIEGLDSDAKRLLQQDFPATDFTRCLIIQEGRQPTSAMISTLMLVGGVIVFLGGGGMLAFGLIQERAAARPVRKKKRKRRVEEEDEEEEEEERPRRRSARAAQVEELEEVDDEEEERPRKRRRLERDEDEEEEEERPRRPVRRPPPRRRADDDDD
jgi:hypothetical protein